jgi:flagellar FliL protein
MATAQPTVDAAPRKGKGKKLLVILVAVLLALSAIGGGGLFYLTKKKAQQEEAEYYEDEEPAARAAKAPKRDLSVKPVFVPLDLFTVNLADRDADRYAQITIALELRDEKSAEVIKNHMPIIRNYILMTLSYKTAAELLERDGKKRLAQELNREIARALGLQVAEEAGAAPASAPAGEDGAPPPRRKPKLKPEEISPVVGVHFSNFIIQ